MDETTVHRDVRRLAEFTDRLVELAAKAERNVKAGVILYAFLDASIRYAQRYVQPGELAQLLRNMAGDLDELDTLRRAQPPSDPAQLN